jgi:hypothetical protein
MPVIPAPQEAGLHSNCASTYSSSPPKKKKKGKKKGRNISECKSKKDVFRKIILSLGVWLY